MRQTAFLASLAAILASAVVPLATFAVPANTVLVEAEAFADLGGWALDAQFIEQMGSPYLLAHGLGQPVRDAFAPGS